MEKWSLMLVSSPKGSLFLESIDASDSSTESPKIISLFKNIERTGAECHVARIFWGSQHYPPKRKGTPSQIEKAIMQGDMRVQQVPFNFGSRTIKSLWTSGVEQPNICDKKLRLDHVTLWCNIAWDKNFYPKEVNISLARINEKRTMVNSGQSRWNKSDKSQRWIKSNKKGTSWYVSDISNVMKNVDTNGIHVF